MFFAREPLQADELVEEGELGGDEQEEEEEQQQQPQQQEEEEPQRQEVAQPQLQPPIDDQQSLRAESSLGPFVAAVTSNDLHADYLPNGDLPPAETVSALLKLATTN